MKVKTFSYHRINRLLLSLLHEILTIGDILKKRRQKVRSDSLKRLVQSGRRQVKSFIAFFPS